MMRVMIRMVKKREERMKRGRNGRREEEEEGQMRGWAEGGVVVDIVGLMGGWVVGWDFEEGFLRR